MTPSEKIHEYAKAVCGQMRWKKAHAVVSEEIEHHLIDQRNAYITEGVDEAAATEKAIVQMGDPVTIGTQLDRTHRPKPQWGMLIITGIFFILGFCYRIWFMNTGGLRWIFDLLLSQTVGFAVLSGAYLMDFTWIGRHPRRLYLLLSALFAVALIFREPALLHINSHSLMLLFPLGFAGLVYGLKGSGFGGIWLSIGAFTLPAVIPLLLDQKWLRSESVLLMICSFLILAFAVSKQWFGVKPLKGFIPLIFIAVAAVTVVTAVVFSNSDRLEWVKSALNPSYQTLEIDSIGWQIKASLAGSKLIGHGVMPGGSYHGIGIGGMELLTGLIYNLGWITLIPITGILIFFIAKGFSLCFKQKNSLTQLVSLAVMLILSTQIIGYVAFNLGFYVLYPIEIPLVSESSTLVIWMYYINAVLIGIMLSIFRNGHVITDRAIKAIPSRRFSERFSKKFI